MSQSLAEVRGLVDSLSKAAIETMVTKEAACVKIPHGFPSLSILKSRKKARASVLREKRNLPIQFDALNPGSQKYHFVAHAAAQAWRKAVNPLLAAYIQARKVAEIRSAHVHAWEAAFSSLYKQEVGLALNDPSHAPRKLAEHAMRVAKMKVGLPPPRADKRFLVEAFWITLDLRFTLASLAQKWLGTITSCPPEQRQAWAMYLDFILKSCSQDASIAFDIADKSGSHLQVTKTTVYRMRAELEQFRFNVDMSRENRTLSENRDDLAEVASKNVINAQQVTRSTIDNYLRVKDSKEQKQWLEDNFTKIARAIIEEWSAIERSLRELTFYQPVSLDEEMSVIRAFSNVDFSKFLLSHYQNHFIN
jgi:hypothetical protein